MVAPESRETAEACEQPRGASVYGRCHWETRDELRVRLSLMDARRRTRGSASLRRPAKRLLKS
jgi:hypothetical protein